LRTNPCWSKHFKIQMTLHDINPLTGTLKLQSTVIGTLAVDGWAVTLVQRGDGWAGCGPPSLLIAVQNVTAHPSTASVSTSYYSMWHYTLPLHIRHCAIKLSIVNLCRLFVVFFFAIIVCVSSVSFYYPTNATLVCVLSDRPTKAGVCVFCLGTNISATVTPIGVKWCLMIELCPGSVFCPFGGDSFTGHQMRGQERGSGGLFLVSQTPIFAIWPRISRKRLACQLELNISSTRAF